MEQISLIMLQQRLSTERSLLGPKSCVNSITPEEESLIMTVLNKQTYPNMKRLQMR